MKKINPQHYFFNLYFNQNYKRYILCNSIRIFSTLILLVPLICKAQTPCSALRWEKGSTWNIDGSINDLPNAPSPNGIVRCGSSAETQSNIQSNGVYDPRMFELPNLVNCINPVNGMDVMLLRPEVGQKILWLNFDIRAYSGGFDFQVIGGPDNIGWALFYTNAPTSATNADDLSGNCEDLTYDVCGTNFTSGWAPDPFFTPDLSNPTNYYIMVWDQNGGDFSINFKARYGCGDIEPPICISQEEEINFTCNEVDYLLEYTFSAINGDFYIVEHTGEGTDIDSEPAILSFGNPSDGNFGKAKVKINYPRNKGYDFSIMNVNEDNCSLVHISGEPPCLVTPVELSAFSSTCISSAIVLDWRTDSETNNDYFIIEKSKDARIFTAIGIVKGKGNTTNAQFYQFQDNETFGRTIYYRLKQVDFDGSYNYSQMISIDRCGKRSMNLVVFPNPFTEDITFELDIESQNVTIQIFELSGRMIYETFLDVPKGYLRHTIPFAKQPEGVYILKVNTANENFSKKIIKK